MITENGNNKSTKMKFVYIKRKNIIADSKACMGWASNKNNNKNYCNRVTWENWESIVKSKEKKNESSSGICRDYDGIVGKR